MWQDLYCQASVRGRYMPRPSDFQTHEGEVQTCSAKAEAQSHQDRGQSTGQETPQAQRRVERGFEEDSLRFFQEEVKIGVQQQCF